MIFFLEASNMIIKRLVIKQLHGIYDYDVKFNDDLTFIFGENGCGKTTILDIVSSIVTGKIYNLGVYNFRSIVLYYQERKKTRLNRIQIESIEEGYEVSLNETEMQERIDVSHKSGDMFSGDDDEYSYYRRFMNIYDFPRFLRETFNYIYLPLSRNSQDGFEIANPILFRRRKAMMYSEHDLVNKNYLNESLRYVEEIIRSGFMRISSAENTINAKFRSNIFTSSLKVTSEYSFNKLLKSVKDEKTLASIERNRKEYIKTLQSIGEWNDDSERRVEAFFKRYRDAFEAAQQDNSHGIGIDFLFMNVEFNRIQEIAAQAQKMEREKEALKAPITDFLSTVNKFFAIGDDKKHVWINEEGKLIVEAEYPQRKLSLYNLSSGEKQIVIIFACLIFGLPSGKSGIYIIDEPEASLHLAWQKNFVKSIREVNSSIQLIFATHSPEIIGGYSKYAVRLRKEVNLPTADKTKEDIYNE